MTPDQNPSWINYKRMAKAALNQKNREFDDKLNKKYQLIGLRRKVNELRRQANKIDARIQKRLDALDV